MTLANPLGLLAGLLAVPLVVWYVLRSRRPRVPVGSTFLWRHSDESVTAALPWQRFRPDRTFWLVLAAILVAALALGRPSFPVTAALGDHTILIMDTSASMLADEDGPSRLELARRAAAELVGRLGAGQTVSIVEAADRARLVLSSSGDAGAARRALATLRPSQGSGDLTDAFTLAAALQRPGTSTVMHLYTDGAIPEAHVAAAPPGLQVTGVGGPRPNLAVTRLQAVPAGGGAAQVFAQVRNFGQLAAQARLRILAGDVELDARDLALLPRGAADVVVEVPVPPGEDGGPAILSATVSALGTDLEGDAAADALAVDDTAAAVVSAGRNLVVLLAGPGNVFLSSALAAVEGVEVRVADRVPADLTGVDLLVVDRVDAPAEPPVPLLAIAPTAGVDAAPPVAFPAVTFADPASELLRDVDLSGLALAEALPISSPTLATVAGGPDGALIAAGRLGGQPAVVLGFDLLASNLPLDVAWPVLVANTVTWLTGPPAAAPLTVGAEVDLTVPAGAEGAEVVPPSGEPVRLDPADPRVRLDQVGIWRPRWFGDPPPDPIAVNAVAEEGDLTRAPAADVPAEPGGQPAAAPRDGRSVLGSGILAVALALLCAEWASSHGVRPLAWLRRRRVRGCR